MKMTKPLLWVINEIDNVATVIGADIAPAVDVDLVGARSGSVRVTQGIPYGHKVALMNLPAEGKVTKYGATIGCLVAAVCAGEHVHVHNMQSLRGRGDIEPML